MKPYSGSIFSSSILKRAILLYRDTVKDCILFFDSIEMTIFCHFQIIEWNRNYLGNSSFNYQLKLVVCTQLQIPRDLFVTGDINKGTESCSNKFRSIFKKRIVLIRWLFYRIKMKSAEEGLGILLSPRKCSCPPFLIALLWFLPSTLFFSTYQLSH